MKKTRETSSTAEGRLRNFDWINRAFEYRTVLKPSEIDGRAPVLYDSALQAPKRIFFSGGCEFTYAGNILTKRGHDVYDTFVSEVGSDPIAEFIGMNGENARRFQPDFIILSPQQLVKQIMRKLVNIQPYPRSEQLNDLQVIISGVEQAIARAREVTPSAKLCLLGNIVYSSTLFGMYEEATLGNYSGDSYSIREMQKLYDLELSQLARRTGSLFLDFCDAIANFGKAVGDPVQNLVRPHEYLGGHPETGGAMILANIIHGWTQALWNEAPKIKLMVLDLDNTLWKGVYREDGADVVGENLYSERLHAARLLGEQGMLLAICSKNDEAATATIEEILKKRAGFWRYVVAKRINWLPKSENIKSIASELNINANTVAFFDDQPFERAEVSAALPQVRVFSDLDLLQVSRYVPFMVASPVSNEGRKRAKTYMVEQTRKQEETKFSATDYEGFLVSCKFRLKILKAGKGHANRVAELFARTNQQNVTLKRTSVEAIQSALGSGTFDIWCCEASDRFGDYGMIGAIMADRANLQNPLIVELAFSCRAMGKGIEKAYLTYLCNHYRGQAAEKVTIPVVRTDKNLGMIDIIKSAGFTETPEHLQCDLCTLPVNETYDSWINWIDGADDNAETVDAV